MSDKIGISAKADANTGMCVDPTSELGLRISTLYTTVKIREATERSYIQCGTFSKQQKSLQHSL
jgi:hypothetical protein